MSGENLRQEGCALRAQILRSIIVCQGIREVVPKALEPIENSNGTKKKEDSSIGPPVSDPVRTDNRL